MKTSIEFQIKIGKIKELEAHNILKNTLINILEYLIDLINKKDRLSDNILLTTSPIGTRNIFLNIANFITKPETNQQKQELLNCLFTILGKGAGDIFQEINAVCKWGGYIDTPNTDRKIAEWGTDGNAIRGFIANDRPSAVRFIFLRKVGHEDEINTLSFGGFMPTETKEHWLLTKNNLKRKRGVGGSYTKKQKRPKCNKTKVNKYKTNKKTKKHIQLKKHKKTKNKK